MKKFILEYYKNIISKLPNINREDFKKAAIIFLISIFIFYMFFFRVNLKEINKLYKQAGIYENKNNIKDANKIYEEIFSALEPNSVQKGDIAFKIAKNYIKLGINCKAKEYFIHAAKYTSRKIKEKSYYNLAEIYFNENNPDYKKTLLIYEYALKNFPDTKEIEIEKVYFNIAFLYQKIELLSTAEKKWNEFMVYFPESKYLDDVKLNLSKIYNIRLKFKEAENYLKEIIKKNMEYSAKKVVAEAFFELAFSLENQGRANEAIDSLENFIENYTDDENVPIAYYKIGKIYEINNNLVESVLFYQKIIEIYPDNPLVPEAYYRIAGIDLKSNKYLQASETLITIIDKYPDHLLSKEAIYDLIKNFLYQNDENKAKEIEKIIKKKNINNADMDNIKLLFADYYYDKKAFNKAQKLYNEILAKKLFHQKRDEILFKRGICLLNLKNIAETWKCFEEIDKDYPQSIFYIESIYIRADYYLKNKDIFNAAFFFEKYYLSFPYSDKTEKAKENTVYCYYKLGNFDKAREIYVDMLDNEETRQEGLEGIADIYFEEQKYGLAKEYFEKNFSLKLSQEKYTEITLKIINSSIKLGSYKKAVELCKKEIANSANKDEYYRRLALIYKKLKQYDLAVEYYEKYTSLKPIDSTNIEMYIDLADSLFYQNKKEKALLIYDTLLSFNIQSEEIAWILNQKAYLLFNADKFEESKKTYAYLKKNYQKEFWGKLADSDMLIK